MSQRGYGLRPVTVQKVEKLNETITQARAVLALVEMPSWQASRLPMKKVEQFTAPE